MTKLVVYVVISNYKTFKILPKYKVFHSNKSIYIIVQFYKHNFAFCCLHKCTINICPLTLDVFLEIQFHVKCI